MQITDKEKILVNALIDSIRVTRQWHGPACFDIYFNRSPEMKPVREALGMFGIQYQDVVTGSKFVL